MKMPINKWSLLGKRIGAAGLFVLVSIASLHAESVWNGAVFGDWKYECSAPVKGIIHCALVQSVIDTSTLETIVRLSIARSPVDSSMTASVLVPLGVDLEEGARLWYGTQRINLPFRMCVIEGCLARRAVSAEDLRRLAVADGLTVEFYAVGRLGIAQAPASSRGLRQAFHELGFIFAELD